MRFNCARNIICNMEELTYTGQVRKANAALLEAKRIEKQKGLKPYYFRNYFRSTSQHDLTIVYYLQSGLSKKDVINKMVGKTYSGEIKLR